MTTPPDPAPGHTPPDPVDSVAPGVGTCLAAWTIAAMGGDDQVPDDLDVASERAFRRVMVAVDALRAAAGDGTADGAR